MHPGSHTEVASSSPGRKIEVINYRRYIQHTFFSLKIRYLDRRFKVSFVHNDADVLKYAGEPRIYLNTFENAPISNYIQSTVNINIVSLKLI